MIINGVGLVINKPIKDMVGTKVKEHGVSYGLSEVGYDIRIKQKIQWFPPNIHKMIKIIQEADLVEPTYTDREISKAFYGYTHVFDEDEMWVETIGKTALASSVEVFEIPTNLWGELRNKSTHARKMFDASLGTDMEPGWKGNLTIEIVFHGIEPITIPAGSGIAKAVFHELKYEARYDGKYQNQPDKPVPAIFERTEI